MIKSIFYSSDSVKGSRRSPSDPTTTLHLESTLKNLKEATEKLEFLQKQVQELTAVSLKCHFFNWARR